MPEETGKAVQDTVRGVKRRRKVLILPYRNLRAAEGRAPVHHNSFAVGRVGSNITPTHSTSDGAMDLSVHESDAGLAALFAALSEAEATAARINDSLDRSHALAQESIRDLRATNDLLRESNSQAKQESEAVIA